MRLTCLLILLIFLLLAKANAAYAQSSEGYKDFVLTGKNVLLLTKRGQLKLINVASGESGTSINTDAPIVALGADRQGNIVAGDTNHLIKSHDDRLKTWHQLTPYSGKLTSLVFNSQNQCFLVTDKGIVDVLSNTSYFPEASFSKNNQLRYTGSWFLPPV